MAQYVSNRCKDLFNEKKYVGSRCPLIFNNLLVAWKGALEFYFNGTLSFWEFYE